MATQLRDFRGNAITPKAEGGGGSSGTPSQTYPYVDSVCGQDGAKGGKETMGNGEYILLSDYPSANTCGECYQFRANITTFNKLKIGRGGASGGYFGSTYNCWLEIDSTSINILRNANQNIGTIAHGLTITDFIAVNMRFGDDKVMHLTIMSKGGMYKTDIKPYTDALTPYWYTDAYGYVKAVSDGSVLTNCHLSATNIHFKSPLWIFGASYEEHSGWQGQVRSMGYSNFLHNAYPGRNSAVCFEDFNRALKYGCPKYLYWTMFGNGSASDLDTYIGRVKQICEENGTTLIIIKRPNSTASDVKAAWSDKNNVIEKYIEDGVRYVDSVNALSTDASNPDGWYDGYLQTDGKHPTALGHKSLAMQVLLDIPEIMQF